MKQFLAHIYSNKLGTERY